MVTTVPMAGARLQGPPTETWLRCGLPSMTEPRPRSQSVYFSTYSRWLTTVASTWGQWPQYCWPTCQMIPAAAPARMTSTMTALAQSPLPPDNMAEGIVRRRRQNGAAEQPRPDCRRNARRTSDVTALAADGALVVIGSGTHAVSIGNRVTLLCGGPRP